MQAVCSPEVSVTQTIATLYRKTETQSSLKEETLWKLKTSYPLYVTEMLKYKAF